MKGHSHLQFFSKVEDTETRKVLIRPKEDRSAKISKTFLFVVGGDVDQSELPHTERNPS